MWVFFFTGSKGNTSVMLQKDLVYQSLNIKLYVLNLGECGQSNVRRIKDTSFNCFFLTLSHSNHTFDWSQNFCGRTGLCLNKKHKEEGL